MSEVADEVVGVGLVLFFLFLVLGAMGIPNPVSDFIFGYMLK